MPRTFLDKMLALKPDPATGKPNPEALKAFAASHPDNAGQAKFLADNNPPKSYANSAYFGIHTFKFINRDNKVTLVRWRFVPQDRRIILGVSELTQMVSHMSQRTGPCLGALDHRLLEKISRYGRHSESVSDFLRPGNETHRTKRDFVVPVMNLKVWMPK